MKNLMKNLVVILLIVFMISICNAATLKWDASTNADGYNIYFTDGTTPFNYNAGNVTEVVDIDNSLDLDYGKTYVFQVTGYNAAGESDLSNSASYDSPASYIPPENIIPIKVKKPTVIKIILEWVAE